MMKFVLIIGTIILYSTPGQSYNNFFHSGQASHPDYWHHGTNFEHDNSRFPGHETQYPFNDYNTPFEVDDVVVPPEIALCQCLRQCYTPREEYPVCGTNHFTYASMEQLICSRECGVDVNLLQRGRCPPKGYYYSKPIYTKPTKKTTEFPKPTEFVTPPTADKYSPQINNCKRQCFTVASYDPVCGTDYVLYYNSELLRCFRNCGVEVDIMHYGKCPTKEYNYPKPTTLPMKPIAALKPTQPTEYISSSTPDNKYSLQIKGCKRLCSTTSRYDPVCGTNYVLYYNPAILGCARECGIDVAFLQQGSCPAIPLSIGDTIPPATDDVISPTTYDDVPTHGNDVPSTTDVVVPPTTNDVVPPTNDDVVTTDGDIPPTGGDLPPTGGDLPPAGGDMPINGGNDAPTGGDISPPGGDIQPTGGDVPLTGGDLPLAGGDEPPTVGDISPPGGDVPLTGGDLPPTGGDMSSNVGDVTTNNSDDILTDTSDKTDSPPLITDDGIKQCLLNCRNGLQYNPYTPVCGTNNIQYDNQRHVLCAKGCGIDVNVLHEGVCESANDITTKSTLPSPNPLDLIPNTSTKLPPELNFDVRIKEDINTSTK